VKAGFFHFRGSVGRGKNAGLITKLITTRGREVLAQVLCRIAALIIGRGLIFIDSYEILSRPWGINAIEHFVTGAIQPEWRESKVRML